MRLWHKNLISSLPRQQLLGQHRECCALKGLGWGKKHSTVDYVFIHPFEWLHNYHLLVMLEMIDRGYKVDPKWFDGTYRGKKLGFSHVLTEKVAGDYPEHNQAYLQECLDNLNAKGITIEWK